MGISFEFWFVVIKYSIDILVRIEGYAGKDEIKGLGSAKRDLT